MKNVKGTIDEILKEPYLRALIYDDESHTYTAEISEFPGCIAQGETPQKAHDRLELVAKSWLEAALELGQEIPKPFFTVGYGGKVALRLPKSLHRQAVMAAERDGVSLNQFIVTSVAEKVGASSLYKELVTGLTRRIKDSITEASIRIVMHGFSENDASTNQSQEPLSFGTQIFRSGETPDARN
jgi:predicted RNase H-like HicB family nuclease